MPNPKSPPGTVLVIGGGVVGLSIALTLQSRGIATTLVDPGDPARAASWGNAGHIATEQVEPLASGKTIRSASRRLFSRGGALALPLGSTHAWLPFGVRLLAASRRNRFEAGKAALGSLLAEALPAWRCLLDLAEAPDLLREDGHYVVWENEGAARAGRAAWAATDTGTATFRDATRDELAGISAQLGIRLAGAIRFAGTGQIADLPSLADALAERFRALGGTGLTTHVTRLETIGEHYIAVAADGERLNADAVIVAAGHGSAALLRPLGHKVPVIPERGYHLQTAGSDWPADLPPVVFDERSMILTRFETSLRAASFVEFADAGTPPDPRKWARLRSHLHALGISFDEPLTQWLGVRPTFPDYLPAVGRSRRAANLF